MNKVLRATLVSAVVITTVIGIASFVLSFAALWDLATMAGVPRVLSWLWPVIVDGTILQATISVITLAQFDDQRSGRRFFWWVLVIAALVSIGANAMHAFISHAGVLHPALSAVIATVAPVSLLAATHGLGILVRIPSETPEPAPIVEQASAVSVHTERPAADTAVSVPPSPEVLSWNDIETVSSKESAPQPLSRPVSRPVVSPAADAESVVEPLEDVDRWILDEERADDLYPVEAP
ncbi:DUF2637 domain-containing protein [Rhodococcoides kyotonense]|uniref:Excisionase n=1 Tax=Rhodococcoides kyotonense TaxID=398843 RepID=A0A239GLY9_9NOCA|nr:DUF2637 domain-containing protein [Rhodococcus kyotonensis]SNS69798.1 Protein of unknown function [Rhodococcus kyotonensis]